MPRIARTISTFSQGEVFRFFAIARLAHKDAGLTVLYAPACGNFGRALIVASRVIGNSPERNKIRRRIRSIFYKEKLYEYLIDCAFIIRKPLLKRSFEDLRTLCLEVLQKTGHKKNG